MKICYNYFDYNVLKGLDSLNYLINWSVVDNVFAVPDCIVDDYIKLADESSLKVILYILKHKKFEKSDTLEVSKLLGISTDKLEDALSYWQQTGVLKSATGENTLIAQQPINTASASKTILTNEIVSIKESPSKYLTPKEISSRIEQSGDVKFLLISAENCFGKSLTYTDQRVLVWIHDYLGLQSDIILMIIEFCKSIEKSSMKFIEKVAVTWHDKNICTHEQAEFEIMQLQKYYSLSGKVLSLLGLNRTLSTKEKEYVNSWVDMNVDFDLIHIAYDKTIDATGKISFAYMNKIISDWHSNGISTKEQVEKNDINYKQSSAKYKDNTTNKSAPPANRHSYDLDLLMQHAANTTPKIKENN